MKQNMSFLTLFIAIKDLKYHLDEIESTVIRCRQTKMYRIINLKTLRVFYSVQFWKVVIREEVRSAQIQEELFMRRMTVVVE